MIRKLCSIGIAYLLALGILPAVVASVYLVAACSDFTAGCGFWVFVSAEVVSLFYFSFITTAIPFAVMRYFAGVYDLLSYKMAALGGGVLGPFSLLIMEPLTRTNNVAVLWLPVFAVFGLVSFVSYWWIEQRVTKALALSDNTLAGT